MDEWDFLSKIARSENPECFWLYKDAIKLRDPAFKLKKTKTTDVHFKHKTSSADRVSACSSPLLLSPDLEAPPTKPGSSAISDGSEASVSFIPAMLPLVAPAEPSGFEATTAGLRAGIRFRFRPTVISYEDLSFGCHLVNPATQGQSIILEKLGRSMLFWYRSNLDKLATVKVEDIEPGFMVAVSFPGSRGFHRGIVWGLMTCKIKVLLLDFGIFVYCCQEDLYTLAPDFTEIEPLAAVCRIVNLRKTPTMQAKLKMFLKEASEENRLEAIVCKVCKPEVPSPMNAVILDVAIMVDGVCDLVDLLPKYRPSTREPRPVENLVPEQEHVVAENQVVNFNGSNYEEFYAGLIENFTTL